MYTLKDKIETSNLVLMLDGPLKGDYQPATHLYTFYDTYQDLVDAMVSYYQISEATASEIAEIDKKLDKECNKNNPTYCFGPPAYNLPVVFRFRGKKHISEIKGA